MIEWESVRESIPSKPGVYEFKDPNGKRLYIGKAKQLRKRVGSYFTKKHNDPRINIMLRKAERVDTVVVNNEVEALLLENQLIKEHQPRYNINLKDAKTYAYVELTDHRIPRLRSTRRRSKHGELFGPYTDGSARRQIIRLTQKLFKIRTCRTLPKRPCLLYHIDLCTAPCVGNVTEEQYAEQVDAARRFLKGETKDVEKRLTAQMQEASQEMEYEVALERKRDLDAIEHLREKQRVAQKHEHDQDVFALVTDEKSGKAIVTVLRVSRGVISGTREYRFRQTEDLFEDFLQAYYQERPVPKEVLVNEEFWIGDEKANYESFLSELRGQRCYLIAPQRGVKRDLVKLAEKNAKLNLAETKVLRDLQRALNLPEIPLVIECFDMSNLQGVDQVGAMTRWVDAQPDKNNYRTFRIRSATDVPDDYRAMEETVWRRYKRLKQEQAEMPDLIVLDGGKGQLQIALEQLKLLDLRIPIIALAKQEEEIFAPGQKDSYKFDPESEMMRFLRRVRDETHRFVLAYHRKRREMKLREQAMFDD